MVILAFAILMHAFLVDDFSVPYVAANSNTHLPFFYKLTALWGAHEGSLLLWVTILAVWTSLVCFFSHNMSDVFRARMLAVMGSISFGFLLFMLLTSNPFLRTLIDIPLDGHDLNPLLQDPGLVIHPPMLYMGYVGTSVAFAFAISALMAGKLDAAWARWSLPWTIAAWCFLTYGITSGSWWSYRDLGWGGWWFWDPVENASFMPWLVTTALIHSLVVTEKRGAFKNWTVLLAILAFVLSLMGTFLVRSGILTSVHAFAVDPSRGIFMLEFLAIVIISSLTLYAWRAPVVGQGGSFNFISRESMLLGNNVLLFVLMATVLLGTLYPLILQVLGIAKISVGPPYFNLVFVPIFCLLLFLMCLAPVCHWQQTRLKRIWQRVWLSMSLSIVAAILLPWLITKSLSIEVVIGFALALWLILSTLQDLFIRAQRGKGIFQLPSNLWAMTLAHIGVAITVIGITFTSHYSQESSAIMQVGDIAAIGPYHVKLASLNDYQGPNYQAIAAHFFLVNNGEEIITEKRFYSVSESQMSIPGIAMNFWRDVYLALGASNAENQSFEVRLYYKPFVRWIWIGGLMMMLGGAIALFKKKR
jgi:cytochrome c-type biogenesis protein CcmF